MTRTPPLVTTAERCWAELPSATMLSDANLTLTVWATAADVARNRHALRMAVTATPGSNVALHHFLIVNLP